MPNYKVFQDVPDQHRVKIFGGNSVAVNTDTVGNVGITSLGLAITAPADGLLITSTGLAVTAPANGLTVTAPASGLSVTPPSGGLLVTGTFISGGVATTDVSYVRANITDTAGSPDTAYNVLQMSTWTLAVINSATAANAQAKVILQTSPNAVKWLDDPGGPVTINQNAASTFVAATFLKYARLYYSAVNSASAVTLNIFFQGQL